MTKIYFHTKFILSYIPMLNFESLMTKKIDVIKILFYLYILIYKIGQNVVLKWIEIMWPKNLYLYVYL